jgi:hypothetical protein
MEASGSVIIGALVVNQGDVVRPSLIASVRRLDWEGG